MASIRCASLWLIALVVMPVLAASEGLTSNAFNIQYGAAGLTSIKRVGDAYDTEYITPGSALGSIVIRYKAPADKDWHEARQVMSAGQPAPGSNTINYSIGVLLPTLPQLSKASASSNATNLAALRDDRFPLVGPGGRGGARGGGRGGGVPISAFTWQGERGNTQWVQYTFPKEEEVSNVQVYWASDDTTDPALRVPASWRLLYEDGSDWKEVKAPAAYGVAENAFNTVNFAPVRTAALRIEARLAANAGAGIYEWRVGPERVVGPMKELKADESFKLNGDILDWSLTIANQTDQPIEIGDLGVPFPMSERTPQEPGKIYTQKLIRHSCISGNGSWIFWQRSNAEGSFLVATPVGRTRFEYYDNTGGGGGSGPGGGGGFGGGAYTPYIHAKVASAGPIAQGGNWRLPITSLTLAPKGSKGDSIHYGFKFQWAKDFDGVREVLYKENLFDVNVVPGMAIPIDLPALVSLRTRNKIDAVVPEFPEKTNVEFVGEKGEGGKVYRVRFSKLGENMIKVKYGGGQWMSLEFFVTEPLETVIQKRANFLVTHMQHNDPSKWYYGSYGDWDQKNLILRSADDRDGLRSWLTDSCDDAGNARPAFIASKNVFFPNEKEIDSVELYIRKFLWNDGKGGMQRTDKEEYAYGIYGIPNWYVNRNSQDPGWQGQKHLWRIYDYPHIILLYYRMYQVAKYYPDMVHYLDAAGYLERAYRTAVAYWTVPLATDREPWSADSVGTMNEAFIPELIEALEKEGKREEAGKIRSHWEGKVDHFVNQTPNLFGSEFTFDSTGFESTGSFAHYALEHVAQAGRVLPGDLPADDFRRRVSYDAAKKFMDFQLRLNMGDRGWLETTYFQLGSDYRGSMSYLLSYMSQLGGWSILDYGLNFAQDPTPYLRLGYASSLSSWALVNSGTAESGYGYWNPSKENDGATGGGFVPEAWGRGWIGKQMARGAWYYSAEEDVGYTGALRTHATIVTRDPIFGEFAYGAELTRRRDTVSVIPRDGLRTRFHVIRGNQRLHMELAHDGYAREQPVLVNDALSKIEFTLENRGRGPHTTQLELSGLPGGNYSVTIDGKVQSLRVTETKARQVVNLPVGAGPTSKVSIERAVFGQMPRLNASRSASFCAGPCGNGSVRLHVPAFISTARTAFSTKGSMSFVATTTAAASDRRRSIQTRISPRMLRSMDSSGSSRITTRGDPIHAAASTALRRCPDDSSRMERLAICARPTLSRIWLPRWSDTERSRQTREITSRIVAYGVRSGCSETYARLRRAATSSVQRSCPSISV